VDVQEIRKLDAYLKRQFGNPRIHVVPKSADAADVLIGEDRVGKLVVDDEDDERSYNFEVKLTMGEAVSMKTLKALEAVLRSRFDNEQITVVARPRKTDSAEVCIGKEYVGVLFFDEKEPRACFFEMPILDFDLEEVREA
jgi:Protein of unknown function (DUF3126)